MNQKNLMQIKEFARLTGIRPVNLRFYDQIGLLSPEIRGGNNYRYYSRRQLESAYLISDLRELGVGLDEIRQYSEERTPEKMLELFERQEKKLIDEIRSLREIQECMQLHGDMAREAVSHEENEVLLIEKKEEPIFLCPPLDREMNGDDGIVYSYEYAEKHKVKPGYPFCAVIALEDFKAGNTEPVSRYYFKARHHRNGKKPAGLYATAYGRCDLWNPHEVYKRLADFINEQNLKPCGDVYEECLLGEMAVKDQSAYGIRIEVRVE